MTYETILVEHHDAVTLITLNRPQALNALNSVVLEELIAAFAAFEADPAQRCAVLTGAGDKAFAAGADIKEMADKPAADFYASDFFSRWTSHLVKTTRKPWIAAVNGFALGGGCELAMMADFIIAADTAKFGQPEIKLGTFPGSGGVFRLPKIVGAARAMELLCFGTALTAREALAMGLITSIAPAGTVAEVACGLAYELSKQAAFAISCIKKTVQAASLQTTAEAVQMSLDCSEQVFRTGDCAEGTRAFLEKRKPRFAGAPGDDSQ